MHRRGAASGEVGGIVTTEGNGGAGLLVREAPAQQPVIRKAGNTNFGNVPENGEKTETFVLENPNHAVTYIATYVLPRKYKDNFEIKTNTCTGAKAAKSTCSIEVTFKPSNKMPYKAGLNTDYNVLGGVRTNNTPLMKGVGT